MTGRLVFAAGMLTGALTAALVGLIVLIAGRDDDLAPAWPPAPVVRGTTIRCLP